MIWSGLGVGMIAGGVVMSLFAVSGARALHQKPLGYSAYDDWYAKYQQDAWTGYGIAGAGTVTLVVGGLYLFGEDGLSRSGKGWLLTSLGVLAGGVGGYLMVDSVALGEAANSLPAKDKNFAPNFEGAEQTWWAGLAAASAGGALALVGTYVALSGGRSSASVAPDGASPWQRVAFVPTVSPQAMGAALHLRW